MARTMSGFPPKRKQEYVIVFKNLSTKDEFPTIFTGEQMNRCNHLNIRGIRDIRGFSFSFLAPEPAVRRVWNRE
jgi:hypothetical protein